MSKPSRDRDPLGERTDWWLVALVVLIIVAALAGSIIWRHEPPW